MTMPPPQLATRLDDCWNRIGVRGDRSCDQLPQHGHCHHCPHFAMAARQLLRRPLPDDYTAGWARHYAASSLQQQQTDSSALIFRIGSEWLALPSHCLSMVAELAVVHKLPHLRRTGFTGVANVGGRLYPHIALGQLLSIEAHEPTGDVGGAHRRYPRTLLLRLGDHSYAAAVSELHGIEHYAASALAAPPATSNKGASRLLRGMLALGEKQVACLDEVLLGYQLAAGGQP